VAAVTVPAAEQLFSTSPGWMMSSPIAARSLRAMTWLLLRMNSFPPRLTSDPIVPPQQ
jgi:hypothetical protein